jgi:hypothetical protein
MLWTGSLSPSGYGQFWLGGRMPRAHRVSLFIAVGPPPSDQPHAAHSTSRRVARAGGFEDAAYIAATNPLVGKALAEWLLDERVRAMNAGTDPNSHALALARLIIGGAE